MKLANRIKSVSKKQLALLHTKFTAVAYLTEGQCLCAIENQVKFLMLEDGTPRLTLSFIEGTYLDPEKTRIIKSIKVKS
jgi:hypothetical protein